MKKLMNILSVAAIFGLVLFQSCETTELDLTKNPNRLSPDQASPDFLLNAIQEDFARMAHSLGDYAAQLTRIEQMSGRSYRVAFQPSNFDDEWEDAYTEIFTDINAMIPLAEEATFYQHIGMGQVLKAYTLATLVDMFGDIPYSEANLGVENFNPKLDAGADVYAAAQTLLDQAIVNFGLESERGPDFDFFYGGDADKWIKAANTLKMRLYMQTRLVDPSALDNFNAIVASGNYISDSADDFQFQWGSNAIQPDARHPYYADNYNASGGVEDYMSNSLMNYMNNNKDPRIRHYYYRQNQLTPGAGAPPALETLQCSLQESPAHYGADPTFCAVENGYWGRAHGNDEGTPPDGFLKTTYGVYPAGGKYDDSTFKGLGLGDGAGGAGITPLLLASSSDFLIAEAAMVANDPTAARAAVLSGVSKSVEKVMDFGTKDTSSDLTVGPVETDVTAHSALIAAAFDADAENGWNVLAQEFFTSLYGNGMDAYNFYRRTGYPTTAQPNLEVDPGGFMRSLFYPANFANNNKNVTQKAEITQQVFWDNNPASPAFPVAN